MLPSNCWSGKDWWSRVRGTRKRHRVKNPPFLGFGSPPTQNPGSATVLFLILVEKIPLSQIWALPWKSTFFKYSWSHMVTHYQWVAPGSVLTVTVLLCQNQHQATNHPCGLGVNGLVQLSGNYKYKCTSWDQESIELASKRSSCQGKLPHDWQHDGARDKPKPENEWLSYPSEVLQQLQYHYQRW